MGRDGRVSVQQLDETIHSLTTTSVIVRATERATLAALPRLRRKAEAAVGYYRTVLQSLQQVKDTDELRYRMAMDGRGTAIVLITSDRGMCGPYNQAVFAALEQHLTDMNPERREHLSYIAVGAKGREYLHSTGRTPSWGVYEHLESIRLEDAAAIAARLAAGLWAGRYSRIDVVFTMYIDAAKSEARTITLFPDIPESPTEEGSQRPDGTVLDFDEDPAIVVGRLIDSYLCGMIYSLLRYSVASEYLARRIAMHTAKEGIDEKLEYVTKQHKKTVTQRRTAELLDIINGFTSQRKSSS